MTVDLGRIKVAYIEDRQSVRVVHGVTGECLREDYYPELTIGEWEDIINNYCSMLHIEPYYANH